MVKKSFLLALICTWLTTACAFDYSKDYEKAKASIDMNASCDELWNELWPTARRGDYVARDLLAELVAERGLKIPGQPVDGNWNRAYLTLALHKGIFETSGDEIQKKLRILGSDSTKKHERLSVSDCFLSPRWEDQVCIDAAARWGIIEPFAEFVQSVDRRLQVGEKVTCTDKPFVGK